MGLMTAGKPTTSAALETSAEDLIRWLAGVGSPARFMHARVFCREHSTPAHAGGSLRLPQRCTFQSTRAHCASAADGHFRPHSAPCHRWSWA